MKKIILLASVIGLSVLIGCKSKNTTKLILSNETGTTLENQITDEVAFSGAKSFKMDTTVEWGPKWSLSLPEIGKTTKNVTLNCQARSINVGDTLLAVFTGNKPGQDPLFYHALPIVTGTKDAWNNINLKYPTLPELTEDLDIAIYFWNQKKGYFYIDNVNVILEE